MHRSRSVNARRLAIAALLAPVLLVMAAGWASAHVEAEAEGSPQAGVGPVVVTFIAEAESTTAGIVSARTQLPAGVLPAWVSLGSGPTGWALTATKDGFQIGGPALAPKVDAKFAIRIGRLPADLSGTLPFKTLVRYAAGKEDAWIEEPTSDNPDPDSPAPTITVFAASGHAAATATTATSKAPAATDAQDSKTSNTLGLVFLGAVVALVAGIGLW